LDRRNGSGKIVCSWQWSRDFHASGGGISDLPGKSLPCHRNSASPTSGNHLSGVPAPVLSENLGRCGCHRWHGPDHDSVSSRTTSVIHRRRQP
jgi:hypothetical protein